MTSFLLSAGSARAAPARLAAWVVVVLGAAAAAQAQPPQAGFGPVGARNVAAVEAVVAPMLDGVVLGDPAWDGAVPATGFVPVRSVKSKFPNDVVAATPASTSGRTRTSAPTCRLVRLPLQSMSAASGSPMPT